MKRIIWLVVIVLLVVGLGLIIARRGARKAPAVVKKPPVSVRVAKAGQGPIQSWVYGEGTARAVKRDFLTFQQQGKVIFIKKFGGRRELKAGDPVFGPKSDQNNGELLAQVDPRDFSSEVYMGKAGVSQASQQQEAVRAGIDQAETAYELAKTNYDRYQKLYNDGAVAKTQLESAKAALDNAAAGLRSSQAQLKAAGSTVQAASARLTKAELALERTSIYAPFDGIIAYINIKTGDFFSPARIDTSSEDGALHSVPIVIIDPSQYEITMELPSFSAGKVKVGQPAYVFIDRDLAEAVARGESLDGYLGRPDARGRVYSVSPAVSPGGRSVQIKIRTDQGDHPIKDGMHVTCWIVVEEKDNAVLVPPNVFLQRRLKSYVFIVDPAAKTARMTETALGLSGLSAQEITSGVNPGDLVVTDGRHDLVSGAPVKIIETH
ncbi:MAG: efflux RND transporter periplasmic adaptor subunit [Proteobacteria bacterium]|nr:efflux RND transporter periplasmic adaptor subunit [Pseudomonadota bacterium]